MMDARSALAERFNDVSMFRTCEQCGCCSSACPITGRDGFNVRRIVHHIELDLVREIAETPHPWSCTTCGRCESVCPNGIAILDIIRPLRAMGPREFIPDGPAPCAKACPGGIDVPGYVRLIAQGKPGEACGLILKSVPFPGILGRVCTHPCEDQCRRGEVNQPIAICSLKRFAADQGDSVSLDDLRPRKETGKRVAVVGSGPSGLTVGFFLRQKGHAVTIFEGREKPGGMMRYGIPAYRLPEDVLDKEISRVLSLGIEMRTGVYLGRDFSVKDLKAQGFDAVFLGLGLQEGRRIDLEGIELQGVMWGLEFLSSIREGKGSPLKGQALVVGGGNVAVDVALTALRLGAGGVTMACLESREEMPANPWEVEMALKEGIKLMPSWGPRQIIGKDDRVAGAELVRCTSIFDEKGSFCPAFGEETETLKADHVILAIGQAADLGSLRGEGDLRIERNLFVAHPETQETSIPGVFAGGDAAGNKGIVIEAIAAGKRAASSMDRFLGGDGIIESGWSLPPLPQGYNGKREKFFADRTRSPLPMLPVSERLSGFQEVELSIGEKEALEEARRCLGCDLEVAAALKPGCCQSS